MRAALPLIALSLASPVAADAPQASSQAFANAPAISVPGVALSQPGSSVCADRIQQVREEHGLPKLDRDNAAPDQPLMIFAVDKRIDGCSVMVMAYDANDIRPVPTEERPARLRKIQ